MQTRTIEQTDVYQDFTNGDLLYGIQTCRQPYLAPLRHKTGIAVTADEYNNKLFGLLSGSSTEADFEITPKKERYLGHYNSTKDSIPSDSAEGRETQTLKKACKANLLRKDIHIRFMLDGINAHDVLDAARPNYKSFTSAEIQYIFQNYEKMHSHVHFYLSGQRTTLGAWLKQANALEEFHAFIEKHPAHDSLAALMQHQRIPVAGATPTPVSSPVRSSSSTQTPQTPKFFTTSRLADGGPKKRKKRDDDSSSPGVTPRK